MTAAASRWALSADRPLTRLARSIGATGCVLASSLATVGAMPALVSADGADQPDLADVDFVVDLPDSFYIMRPAPGAVKFLAEADLPDDLVGKTCTVSLVSLNQHSAHPGNNVLLTSGTDSGLIEEVESDPNGTTTKSVDLTLGDSILAELKLGPEGLSSLGFDLGIDCSPQVSPTSVVNTTTSTAPSTTVATTPSTTRPSSRVLPTILERCPDGSTPVTDGTGTPGSCPTTTTADSRVLPTSLERCPDGSMPADNTQIGDPDRCPSPTVPPTTTASTSTTQAPSTTTTSQPKQVAVRGIQTLAATPVASPVAATPTYAG